MFERFVLVEGFQKVSAQAFTPLGVAPFASCVHPPENKSLKAAFYRDWVSAKILTSID